MPVRKGRGTRWESGQKLPCSVTSESRDGPAHFVTRSQQRNQQRRITGRLNRPFVLCIRPLEFKRPLGNSQELLQRFDTSNRSGLCSGKLTGIEVDISLNRRRSDGQLAGDAAVVDHVN